MINRTVGLGPEEAYSELKAVLLNKGAKILSEERPKSISIEHGSLRGVTPKSAKKITIYNLAAIEEGTRITAHSSVSPHWAKLTLWGNIAAAVVAALFWWIATDMNNLVANGTHGFWTWLARAFGYPDVQYTLFMIYIVKALSIVLVITIFLEILDAFVVYRRIDAFAAETLEEIAQK